MKTILIADDNQESLYMLEFLLKSNKYQTEQAFNGAEALFKALNNPPDMIISDILMPEMDGYMLCREWMKNELLKNIPFVFYTATYTNPSDEEFAMKLGASKFVIKPQEPGDFLNIIKEVLGKYERGQVQGPREVVESEAIYLKEYNQALIRKLEDKMLNLEMANKSLKQEIEERKRTENALRKSEEKYQMLVEQASDGIFSLDPDGNIVDGNTAGCTMMGYSREELTHINIKDLITRKSLEETPLRINELKEGKVVVMEREVHRKDGSIFPVEVSAKMLPNSLMQGILRDITQRKKDEEYIRESLEEKKVLLREIHHRVKNNLQIIISLLELQTSKIKNNQALESFRETKNRVYSMALIHDKLYQSEDFSKIDFGDFLETIIRQLFGIYDKEGNITLESNIRKIFLEMNTAVPCGLIANELLANALEHAFPGERQGQICVSFQELSNQTYELIVQDNGVGMPDPGNLQTADTIGLQLVKGLVEQIDGTLEIGRGKKGTKIIITFGRSSTRL